MGTFEALHEQLASAPAAMPENIVLPENATGLGRWRNDDTGSVDTKVMILGGSMAIAAGLGLLHRMGIGVSQGITLKAGTGVVESTYVMPADVCHGGYVDYVKGASAKDQLSVHATVPIAGWRIGGKIPTDWESETFNGNVTSVVCNTGTNGTRRVNQRTHTDTVSIPEGSLNTYVFVTNPLAKNYTSDGGFLGAETENQFNLLNSIPGIHIGTEDSVHDVLQGFAELEAFNTSATTCGDKVWEHEEEAYIEEVKQDEVTQLDDDDSSHFHWTTRDVVVHAPATANFHTQYGNYLEQAENQLKSSGTTINAPTTAPVCEDTSGPTQVLQSATEATDAGLSPHGIITPPPTATSGGTK